MQFHEDILNSFQVTERTRLCDGQTDGQTTQAKTMSPNPNGGGGDIDLKYRVPTAARNM